MNSTDPKTFTKEEICELVDDTCRYVVEMKNDIKKAMTIAEYTMGEMLMLQNKIAKLELKIYDDVDME